MTPEPAFIRNVPVMSKPRVRVSRPLVKYCRPLTFVKLLAARMACVTLSAKVALSRIRWLILIWNASTVNVTLSFGLNAKPALTFTDFSACSGFELNSRAALSATGTMSTSVTTPPMTFVFTRLKCD